MMLESAPAAIGLLGGPGSGLAQQLAQTALDRSGVVNGLREWSIDQYQQGLAISPIATNAGVAIGVGGAVLVDVLIPGVGVEMSMAARAHRGASTTAPEVAALIEGAGHRFAAHATELHHPIPRFLGGHNAQTLSRIPTHVHQELHSQLRQALNASGIRPPVGGNATRLEWANHLAATPGSQGAAFDAVMSVSKQIDAAYGTNVVADLAANLSAGRYFPL
jgi:hypothetical protein